MTTFTEIVAAVVVQSSAVALSHFGVTLQPAQPVEHATPAAERVVARTPPRKLEKLTICPRQEERARVIKA